jgi:hypothetical protein
MGTAMIDCGQSARDLLARLATPSRNRYYYGKLLDAYHFELEQRYGNNKRWLLNRLSLGSGVLCGLDVVASTDAGRVRVSAGVAIDGVGREILVPQDSLGIDPRQPTDDCGRPDGPPLRGDEAVTLYVCYLECEAEPAPVLVSECGPERSCENGLVRERYRLRIQQGEPAPPGLVTDEQCSRIFAEPPADTSRRTVVCETLGGACLVPDEACVPLAVIRLGPNGGITSIEQCRFRRTLYSNAVLLDLILCLARRVDECCGALTVRSLLLVSGNNQTAPAGQAVPLPLVTRVVDGGTAVVNEPVTFDVVPGGGAIGDDPTTLGPSFATNTDAAGIATLPVWRLGPTPGIHRVTARIASGTPSMVTFVARAERVVVDLPVVRVIWPTNTVRLDRASPDPVVREWFGQWLSSPRIEVTFNHKMNEPQLGKPDPWLRVFMVRSFGQNEIEVRRLNAAYGGPVPSPILPDAGFTELFAIRGMEPDMLRRGARFLVQMRAEGGNILDTGTPPQLLDAEFPGTRLTPVQLDEIWKATAPQGFPQAVWDGFVDTGARLPQSGDGTEGGIFHSWFEVSPIG